MFALFNYIYIYIYILGLIRIIQCILFICFCAALLRLFRIFVLIFLYSVKLDYGVGGGRVVESMSWACDGI